MTLSLMPIIDNPNESSCCYSFCWMIFFVLHKLSFLFIFMKFSATNIKCGMFFRQRTNDSFLGCVIGVFVILLLYLSACVVCFLLFFEGVVKFCKPIFYLINPFIDKFIATTIFLIIFISN
jgi:hypothetical protein